MFGPDNKPPDHLACTTREPACQACGAPLQQKPRYDYAEPFVAPHEWCPTHGYHYEQAERASSKGSKP